MLKFQFKGLKFVAELKKGTKNETTFWVKRTTSRPFGTFDVYARIKQER